MPRTTKIATCCYCGTRAALVLSGETRHELSCSACGAPLHRMKMLPQDPAAKAAAPRPEKSSRPKKRKKAKMRKGLWARALEEAFDLVEDVFD
ncbi:hypothetical protein [Pseudodonghicola flavimaris]|uniref:Uncharacterized protein n=1 Tax=Pseudodonghicola flavimaris TaxID=3050036 RepID=A0ABT7F0A3_9RHOB|nr:hypothetical protein [Pseudodonghicola flavimaris]MDK3018023.1 hypothetical protein [Pseudodonghicola flavimaris]